VSGTAEQPQLDPELIAAASARLSTEDVPIAAMLLTATPVDEVAHILDMSVADVRRRGLRIIGRLQAGNRLKASVGNMGARSPE
jgi:translation initiation factor 6 (eIF-6)